MMMYETRAVMANAASPASAADVSTHIVLDGVGMTYRSGKKLTQALERADLTIMNGEFISIVGPSGCGKSTLLRIIAGLLTATDGNVLVDSTLVAGPVTNLGIVFQSPVLLDWRNIRDNVLVQIELRKLPRAMYIERTRVLLEAVGLGEFADRYPHELSGGMRQRAAIVRALIHDPPLLLMDEPFGALDALTREQMRIDLEQLWLQGRKTVFFITHSIDEAVLLSDRVVVMSPRPGRIERIIDVTLPRPRGLEARNSRAFEDITSTITEIFLSRGVLHRGSLSLKPQAPVCARPCAK
jgi:NitT/TauT family transport system ATP-binding protein